MGPVAAALLLMCGGLLALVGSVGLLRLRSFYARMHPVTMGTTLGTGCVLIASMLVSSALLKRPVVHEVLITCTIRAGDAVRRSGARVERKRSALTTAIDERVRPRLVECEPERRQNLFEPIRQ